MDSYLPSICLDTLPSLPNLSTLSLSNTSLYSIPVAWFISILAPRIYGRYLYYTTKHQDMDVLEPRKWSKSLELDDGLDEKARGRIMRSEAAMNNGHENIGLFAAGVVAGNAAGLHPDVLNGLAWGFVGSRVAFNVIYILQDRLTKVPARAVLRPVVFFAGVGCYMALFCLAGKEWQRNAVVGKG